MAEKIERQLPIGIGGEKLKEGREILPAVEVANEVSWVNNKMNLPFNLKVGEATKLGIFLTPNPQEGESTYNLEVSGSHTRSGILGRVIFSDKEGRLYRDIDLKGIGFNKGQREGVKPVSVDDTWVRSNFSSWYGTSGIADQELIRRDINYSEKFLKAGIRVHRVIALIEPKEIIDQGGVKISIAEAKKRGILKKKDEPIIEVRAFGVRSRLFDVQNGLVRDEKDQRKALELLLDAKTMVAQELNIDPEKFTYDDYFEWLIKTIAINVARMHYNKWVNGYLTSHNLTLDGRIVDLDSVVTVEEAKKIEDPLIKEIKTFEFDRNNASESLARTLRCVIDNSYIYSGRYSDYNSNDYFEKIYSEELSRLKTEKVPRIRN